MAPLTLKKHPATRAAHYLYLLPFLPALQPLLVNYRMIDMIIYLAGIVLVLFLVIYGNHRPLLRVEPDRVCLYLHYRHNAEYHPFSGMIEYKRLSTSRITLFSKNQSPVILNMKKKDVEKLISRLEEKNIHATETEK